MNRLLAYWDTNMVPRPSGPFSDSEALELLMAYRQDPSSVPCPICGPDQIEIIAFIDPEIDEGGFAHMTDPDGEYAAAVYCHTCKRAIGILAGTDTDT